VERAGDIRYRRAMKLTSEQEEAAAKLLREIHAQAQAILRKIDADLAESRRQARLYAKLKIQTHNETMVWLKAHPDEVQAISELFGF
jgi:16S rRNA C1402 (ribose-2'-O) methylase RsmI